MIVMIAGSRAATPANLTDAREIVRQCNEQGHFILVGDAEGVDEAVIRACADTQTPCLVCAPDKYLHRNRRLNLRAMYVNGGRDYRDRDRCMIAQADACVFIWNGISPGTLEAYEHARRTGKFALLLEGAAAREAAMQTPTPFQPLLL